MNGSPHTIEIMKNEERERRKKSTTIPSKILDEMFPFTIWPEKIWTFKNNDKLTKKWQQIPINNSVVLQHKQM